MNGGQALFQQVYFIKCGDDEADPFRFPVREFDGDNPLKNHTPSIL
jgi:hypothetical protein